MAIHPEYSADDGFDIKTLYELSPVESKSSVASVFQRIHKSGNKTLVPVVANSEKLTGFLQPLRIVLATAGEDLKELLTRIRNLAIDDSIIPEIDILESVKLDNQLGWDLRHPDDRTWRCTDTGVRISRPEDELLNTSPEAIAAFIVRGYCEAAAIEKRLFTEIQFGLKAIHAETREIGFFGTHKLNVAYRIDKLYKNIDSVLKGVQLSKTHAKTHAKSLKLKEMIRDYREKYISLVKSTEEEIRHTDEVISMMDSYILAAGLGVDVAIPKDHLDAFVLVAENVKVSEHKSRRNTLRSSCDHLFDLGEPIYGLRMELEAEEVKPLQEEDLARPDA